MKKKILFVERNFWKNAGIEKVFRQIAKDVHSEKFDIEIQTVNYGNNISGMLKNLLFFRKKSADIYHITGQIHYLALLFPKNNTILTIHDLIFLHNRKGIRRYLLKKLLLDLPVKRLKYITAISNATRDEILEYTGCSGEKVRVIENPLFDAFKTVEEKEFNKESPLILHIGTAENKNIENLIDALKGLTCRLRIVGKLEEPLLGKIKESKIIFENTFGLDEEQMVDEYRNADIVSFCSTYEGFGLPILEANAMRTPVITSDLSPMKEVAGNAAHLVDPFDIKSIRNGITKLLSDHKYRKVLIKNGLDNIHRFNSKEKASEYLTLYNEVHRDTGT